MVKTRSFSEVPTWIVGIDPGSTGAWSVWKDGEFQLVNKFQNKNYSKYKIDFKVVDDEPLFHFLSNNTDFVHVFIERQWGRPISGSKQSFITGFNYNQILKMLVELNESRLEVHTINPNDWMKHFWGKEKNQKKKLSLKYASQYNPYGDKVKDHNIADAILIGKYGVEVLNEK